MSAATVTTSSNTKRRVLVVDDEDNVTHLVSSALRFDGFETVTADSGTAALAKVAEADPDLIVLDVMMPGLDGLGVLQNLRAAGSQVPVIFLTARDAASDRIVGLRAGADDYVVKPFSIEELLARVHAVLRRSAPETGREGVLHVADLELDENSHEVDPRRRRGALNRHRVRAASLPHAQRAGRAVEDADPRPGVEVRLPGPVEHRRALHRLPAQEGRQRRTEADPHDPRRRLRHQGAARVMSAPP